MTTEALESAIAEWRELISTRRELDAADIDAIEFHLRDQMADLRGVGLSADEAFFVAVKRFGGLEEVEREHALRHDGRLWNLLVGPSLDKQGTGIAAQRHVWTKGLIFAVAAGAAVELAQFIDWSGDHGLSWFTRNAAGIALWFLVVFLGRLRGMPWRRLAPLAIPFVIAAVAINAYPVSSDASTAALAAVHLPFALWAVAGTAYAGGDVWSLKRRMDFVRFTGEWCIYYALIALGGGALVGLTLAVLDPIGIDPDGVAPWLVVPGAAGAVLVSAVLVERKDRIVESLAPLLTNIFTPLFAAMLAVATVTYTAKGFGGTFERELVGTFDALMAVVLGLVVYGVAARDRLATPDWMDRMRLFAVLSALALDVVVLAAISARISELGFTPNRAAALGLNLTLLCDLVGTAWVYGLFVVGRGRFASVERWQMLYLPVYVLWAAGVVLVFPPAFSYA